RAQGAAQFHAALKTLELSTLPDVPKNLKGTVSVEIDATAPRPELTAITGTITFPELRIQTDGYAVEQQGVSTIALANGALNVQHFQLTGPLTQFEASGTASLLSDHSVNVSLDGTIDAALLSTFTDAVRANGKTELHAKVTGTVDKPEAAGYAQ